MHYHIGLDGFNVLLVLLTAFLGPLVVAGAFSAIQKDVKLFYAMVFLIQFTMLGTFLAQDLFLFYVFWEAMLIPMFLIIGIWGGERRIYATVKFVLYTAFGSILMLAAIIYLVYSLQQSTGVTSFSFADLYRHRLPLEVQGWLLAAFALSFAIKVPIVPLHTWLPDAHVEAPTAGSVILAGVLLKMGTYGFIKLGFPLFPQAARAAVNWVMLAAVVSIVYGACLALVQTDIKKIIAYSSISHLGYVMLGLASLDLIGIQGAIIQMVSHGLTAAGLFLMVGMIYERCHTRELAAYGGLAKILPVYSVFFMILTLAAIGLPTTSGFTGEFLVLLGAFNAAWPLHLAGRLGAAGAGGGCSDRRRAGRDVHAVVRAALPLWRGQGAARADHRSQRPRARDPGGAGRRRVLAGSVPAGGAAQDRGRRHGSTSSGSTSPARAPAATAPVARRAATGGRAMNWSFMLIGDAARAPAARRHRRADRARRRSASRRAGRASVALLFTLLSTLAAVLLAPSCNSRVRRFPGTSRSTRRR